VFAFVRSTRQWKETGRPSRFAYGEAGVQASPQAVGSRSSTSEVEREVATFESVEQALARRGALREQWRRTVAGSAT